MLEPSLLAQALALEVQFDGAGLDHLDLATNIPTDLADHPRQTWFEARHHGSRPDIALQRQLDAGAPWTQPCAVPRRRSRAVLTRHHF